MFGFAGLIETVVSFDWRFCASNAGFGVPPSTLLLSLVTFTSAPSTACAPSALGTSASRRAHAKRVKSRRGRPEKAFISDSPLSFVGSWYSLRETARR